MELWSCGSDVAKSKRMPFWHSDVLQLPRGVELNILFVGADRPLTTLARCQATYALVNCVYTARLEVKERAMESLFFDSDFV